MFKKINWTNLLTIIVSLSFGNYSHGALTSVHDAEQEFDKAWKNPAYTHIELKPVDINSILSAYYTTESGLKFTQNMLWDLERKKAWNPEVYISQVVKPGSGKSWQREVLADGNETFVRSTQQRQWLHPEQYGGVFEQVFVNNKDKKVTFIGVSVLRDESGVQQHAQNPQPLFHVQHGAAGTQEHPLNTWRIIFLANDNAFIKLFQQDDAQRKALPGYIAYYIENDLGIKLNKK